MFRASLFIILSAVIPVTGQSQPARTPNRPVLKALPLGEEEGPATGGQPGQTAKPLAAPPSIPLKPVPQTSPLDKKPAGDDALRLQIYLDQSCFGPGIIDGKPGQFTELAVQSWNEVHGYPPEDWVAVNTAARKAVLIPLAVAVVPDVVKNWVNPDLPTKVTLQAKQKKMSYRSVGEFMAERYHCDETWLATVNGAKKMENLKARDSITVPNIEPFYIEKLTGIRYAADPALSQRHVVVDTKINQARIFEAAPTALVVAEPGAETITPPTRANRGLIASFPITPGQPKFIKFGTWELRSMVQLPNWRFDQQLLDTGKRSGDSDTLNIPPGPKNPVGVIWNGLSKPGIGMHGTPNPETIGRARSHGCIRLANWDAIRLPDLIRPGATVEIR